MAGLVVAGAQPFGGHGHANAGGRTIAQWAGGCLDPCAEVVFGVTGANAVELAEALDVIDGNRRLGGRLTVFVELLDSGQMDDAVKKHGSMAGGEHEPVAIPPSGVGWIVIHEMLVKGVNNRCQGNGCARVT